VFAATSMRALLRMLPTAPAPDPIRAITWLSVSASPGAETFARGIERLPGAHAVVIEDGVISTRRWWQPVYREPMRATRAPLTQRLRASLGQAVRERASPTETTGLMVSGGFDSSAVAGVAATERAPTQLRTYSAGFPDDPSFDESARVRALVAARNLPNYLLHIRPVGTVRLALEYQRDWGIPSGGPGYLLERPLLERAGQDGVGGMLDGQGGDELFGVRSYLIADRVRRGQLRAAQGAAPSSARVRDPPVAALRPRASAANPWRRDTAHAGVAAPRPAGAVPAERRSFGLEAGLRRTAVVAPSRPRLDDEPWRTR
jgi:asparagine synthase (glutamine-hydrolysing)